MSWIIWRGKPKKEIAHLQWYDENGIIKSKSLKTNKAAQADVLKGDFDRAMFSGQTGLPDQDMRWSVFKQKVLGEYTEGQRTWDIMRRALQGFEDIIHPIRIWPLRFQEASTWKQEKMKIVSLKTGKRLSATYINMEMRALHTAWNFGLNLKVVPENIFSKVKEIPTTKKLAHYLTIEEMRRFVNVAKDSYAEDAYLMVLFLLQTGIRNQALINLKWTCLDLEKEIFYLQSDEHWQPKDRQEQGIGLHPVLAKLFREKPKTSEYVFPGRNGKRRYQNSVQHLFKKLYKRAGINAGGCHILRHSFATHSKLHPTTLQAILGHANLATTQRYTHVTSPEIEAIKGINIAIFEPEAKSA